MKLTLKALSLAILGAASTFTFAEEAPASEHTVSGNIGVVSQYVLRGNTASLENDNAAVQGGLDYSHDSGFYLGYWFSTLGYSYAGLQPGCLGTKCTTKSFENDFYAGFKGKLNDEVGYTVGGTIYYYYPGWESMGYETMLGLNYKEFSVSAQTLLNNVTFGNQGDTYFLATYAPALPAGFTGKVQLAAYYYGDDDEFTGPTTTDFAFRHATLGLSHPLGATGANMSLDYVFGGYARDESKQKNKVVLGASYTF